MNSQFYLYGGVVIGIIAILFLLFILIFMNTLRMYNDNIKFNDKHVEHENRIESNFKIINDIQKTVDELEDNVALEDKIESITTDISSLKKKDVAFEDIHLSWTNQFDSLTKTQEEDHKDLEGIINNKLLYANVSEENSEMINKLEDEIDEVEGKLSSLQQKLDAIGNTDQ